jgi:hypothetical protein
MNDEKRVALVEERLRGALRWLDVQDRRHRLTIDHKGHDSRDSKIPCVEVSHIRRHAEELFDDTLGPIIDRIHADHDIDAMLDAVHPQARLNYLGYADFDLCWNAYLWTPDFVATTGTGPTRTAAIADACKRALEGRNDEL